VEGSHSAVDRRGYFRMYIIDIINSMLRCVVSSELVGRDHGTEREREREREKPCTREYTLSRKIFHAL
jgi:hypothetical protein